MTAKITTGCVIIISLFLTIFNAALFNHEFFNAISIAVIILAYLPLAITHGKGRVFLSEIKLIVILTILSLIAMMFFKTVPFFRPLIAMIFITGMYFGACAGYICGTLTIFIISYAFLGTGEWTPFQIMLLGIIGFVASLFSKSFLRNNIILFVCTLLSSVMFTYSNIIQDILIEKNKPDYTFHISFLFKPLKWALIYAISDFIIILLFRFVIGKKMIRLRKRLKIFK